MAPKPTKAMVLAAGLGTRMRPLTDHLPKPLITVAGKTLLDYALDWLDAAAISDVVVNSHYKYELLEAHLATRAHPRITISREEPLLETGGGLKKALPWLGTEPFVSLNSDTICIDGSEPALGKMSAAWDDNRMDALLLLHPLHKAIGYQGKGDFFIEPGGALRRRAEGESAAYVFTGVQLLHPRIFAGSPEGAFSMNMLYNRGMSAAGVLHRVGAVVHTGDWLHIGTPAERELAERWFKDRA